MDDIELLEEKPSTRAYHNHLLKYSYKRFENNPPVYRAIRHLAALDYNNNVDRQPIQDRDRTLRYF